MKKQLTLLLVTLTLLARGQQLTADLFDNRQKVEQWLKEDRVPALGIGILREGRLTEIRMYGELKPGVSAPYNAIFNVASLTKPVVTLLTLKLVSSGAWSLDEPLARYWVDPDIASDARHQKLTTRLVLSHQTGFKNWRYLNTNGKLSFDAEPGTRFGYSGEGFEYLRKALESKFHKSLAQLSDSLLFRPLGMQDTRYAWDRSTDDARFAHWFDTSGREHPRDYKKTVLNAADDLLTTIEDYGRFSAYVLQGGGLDTSVFRQMVQPQVPTKDGRYMSLGWELFLNLGPQKEYALVHSGSDAGVQTLVVVLPVSGQGLVVFTNGDNGYNLYDKLVIEFLDAGKEIMAQVK